MSTYTSFFVRTDDKFIPIGTYGAGSTIAHFANPYALYEHLVALTGEDLRHMIGTVRDSISDYKKTIDEKNAFMTTVLNSSMPYEEKMDTVDDIREDIKSCEDEIHELTSAMYTYDTYIDIIEAYKYDEYYKNKDDVDATPRFSNDYNHYLYVGIEVCGRLDEVVNVK